MNRLSQQLRSGESDMKFFGLTPPRLGTPPAKVEMINRTRAGRLCGGKLDGLLLYDIQDEASRTAAPRPFPFRGTLDSVEYGSKLEAATGIPRIQFLATGKYRRADFIGRLTRTAPAPVVLVGPPSSEDRVDISSAEAWKLARDLQPEAVLGGVAIAERRRRNGTEAGSMIRKVERGASFFVTQCIYDAALMIALLEEYAYESRSRGVPPAVVILCFSPIGSARALELVEWLGVAVPETLKDDIRSSDDPLAVTTGHLARVISRVTARCGELEIPFGVSVESVAGRKADVLASLGLLDAATPAEPALSDARYSAAVRSPYHWFRATQ